MILLMILFKTVFIKYRWHFPGRILGENKFENATDEQLREICEVAKKLGFDIAPNDIKEGTVRELAEGELADVVGGYRLWPYKRPKFSISWLCIGKERGRNLRPRPFMIFYGKTQHVKTRLLTQ